MPDGREICNKTPAGKREYHRRITLMFDRDKGICCLCGQPLRDIEATFEHKQGRGMNGSKRDDRPEVNGVSHYWGNMAKGSISYALYMEKPLFERVRLCQGK
jgi:hypothetical protein